MEQLLRTELHTRTLRAFGSSRGGCISEGYAYYTDSGPVFVKVNRRTQVRCRVYKDKVWEGGRGMHDSGKWWGN